jgi:hypothetical protein
LATGPVAPAYLPGCVRCPIPQKRLNQAVSAGVCTAILYRLIADGDLVVYCPEWDERKFCTDYDASASIRPRNRATAPVRVLTPSLA